MLVGPRLSVCGEAVSVELPRGNEHLLQLVLFRVAVDINVIEDVIRHKGLQLLKRLPSDAVIPQPDIAENRRIRLQYGVRRFALAANAARLDTIEAEAYSRECDIVRDVRR